MTMRIGCHVTLLLTTRSSFDVQIHFSPFTIHHSPFTTSHRVRGRFSCKFLVFLCALQCFFIAFPAAMNEIAVGTRVQYSDGRAAIVRYSGTTHFSPGHWIGIELEEESGKNDGAVKGHRYFTCPPGYGMFVRPETISTTPEQDTDSSSRGEEAPLPSAAKTSHGIEKRSRQSIMSAEAARRRQSLMRPTPSRSTPSSMVCYSTIISQMARLSMKLTCVVSSQVTYKVIGSLSNSS